MEVEGEKIGKDRARERNTVGERGRSGHRDRNRSRDMEKQDYKGDRQRNGEIDKESETGTDTGRERQGDNRCRYTGNRHMGTGDRGGRREAQKGHWKSVTVGTRLAPSPLSKSLCCLDPGEREAT